MTTIEEFLTEDKNDQKKHRDWVMTVNNYTEQDLASFKILTTKAQYSICGLEVGKQGTPHMQCYLYFKCPRSFMPLKKAMPRAYIAPAKGNAKQNRTYCSKEGNFTEVGTPPEQGKRTDLDEIKNNILGGQSVDSIVLDNPMIFHQYGRTLERIEAIALRQKFRNWMTKGIWITGPSGSGKSHKAFENFSPDTHYVKNLNEEWWDGYKGQPIVILNEFRGQISFSEILDLVDKWPKQVKWRGKESVPFLAEMVIITSIKTPRQVFVRQEGEPWEQFDRRFEVIELMEQKCSEGNIRTSEPIFQELFGD